MSLLSYVISLDRRTWIFAAAGIVLVFVAVMIAVMAIRASIKEIERQASRPSLAELRLECEESENQIDSMLIHLSLNTSHTSNSAHPSASLAKLAESVRLELIEVAELPSTSTASPSERKWRYIGAGSADAWGKLLLFFDRADCHWRIESAKWQSENSSGTRVRGELMLRLSIS